MDIHDTKTIADFLVADFEREIRTTLAVLAAVPTEHLDYRPDRKSRTGLGLVRHVALEDEWMLQSIVNGVFASPPDESDACGIMCRRRVSGGRYVPETLVGQFGRTFCAGLHPRSAATAGV